MRSILYAGSFDPVTNGHMDVIERACKLFDKVYVGVAVNSEKNPLFTVEERADLLKKACAGLLKVEVVTFAGLLIDAVVDLKVSAVLRGLRAVSDFEYELQMALMNRELCEKCETIFMMPRTEYSFLSSRVVKEIARFGGDVSAFAPMVVVVAMKEKMLGGKERRP
jgi:pantetheine-phosphate adenylyltransferase